MLSRLSGELIFYSLGIITYISLRVNTFLIDKPKVEDYNQGVVWNIKENPTAKAKKKEGFI